MSTTNKFAHHKISELRQKLALWEIAYYQGHPLVTDELYDASLQELIGLEQAHPELYDPLSPTMRVGKDLVKNFVKTSHTTMMLSLDNAFNQADLQRFYEQVLKQIHPPFNFIIEPKIDGSSISLVYENNKLVQAVTRGDGKVGENIINNIKTIQSIPLIIPNGPGNFEVRGEIFMTKSQFVKYNASLGAQNQKVLANPRNAVAGALRLQDPQEVAKKPLSAVFYQLIYASEIFQIPTQAEVHQQLQKWSLPTLSSDYVKVVDNIQAIIEFTDFFAQHKNDLDIPCDGLVIKLNQLELHEQMGATSKFPKWAIAYKFPANIKQTQLLNITATTGRTGKITYIAELSPVAIDGTMVSAATLHNAEYIMSKDIRINDLVTVYKAGEIIPKIIAPNFHARSADAVAWKPWTHCPSCHQALIVFSNQVDQYCTNHDCIEKIYAQITHWCSRKALNIEGLSKALIIKFYQLNLLKSVADLYKMHHHEQLITAANIKVKQKLFAKIVSAIDKTKNSSLERVLFGLGIHHVGLKVATILAQHYLSMDNLQQADWSALDKIEEIGPTIVESLKQWFSQTANLQLIAELKQLGLTMTYQSINHKVIKTYLQNKKVVVTGTLSMPRHELVTILQERFLCQIQSSVSKKTDYLIVGQDAGSKLLKAQELHVPIIEIKEIEKLIDETN